jgi:chromate reductase
MRIATLCGSHHTGSTNAVVISHLTASLTAAGCEVHAIDVSADLPAFRPEAVDDPPAGVASVRDTFRGADAVVFAVPEYAGGPPGWVKNITDWMVSRAALYRRPTVVLSAATTGGGHAISQLAHTLTWQGAAVVATCGIAAPLTMVRGDRLTDADVLRRLDVVARTLVEVLRGELPLDETAAAAMARIGVEHYAAD